MRSRDDPIRLKEAARLAFPDGTMKESGLRREAARGRLVIERIAGKDYTTLRAIERMRQLCRVDPKAPTSSLGQQDPPRSNEQSGSSKTEELNKALDAALLTIEELKKL